MTITTASAVDPISAARAAVFRTAALSRAALDEMAEIDPNDPEVRGVDPDEIRDMMEDR